MKKPVNEYTDEEIIQRLGFADRLMSYGKDLPSHLEAERQELIVEQLRRVSGTEGAGI